MQLACGVGNHLLDFDRCLGAFTLQLSSDVVRCLGNQLLENMPGCRSGCRASRRGWNHDRIVRSCAGSRNPRIAPGILGQRSNDVLIAGDDRTSVRAIAIRVLTSSRAECRRMGPAISIEASRASCLIQLNGAFPECASRLASSARATASIPRARRSMISPKVQISCSEYCPDIRTSVACHKARSRLSSQPRAIDSSSCLKSDAESVMDRLKCFETKMIGICLPITRRET